MGLTEVLLLTTVEMGNVLLAYIVIFGAKLNKNKIFIFITYFVGLVIQFIFNKFIDNDLQTIITTLYGVVIPLCWLDVRKRKWFALYPFIWFGMSIINTVFSYLAAMYLGVPEVETIYVGYLRAVIETGGIVLLLLILLVNKIRKKERVEVEFGIAQYILLFAGIVSSAVVMGCVQFISGGEKLSVWAQNFTGFFVSSVFLVFIVACLWQGIIMRQKMEYKNKTENYEKFMHMQEEQIHRIIDKDDKMRKFRHDMASHLVALRGCVKEKDYDKLLEYLDEMENNSYVKSTVTYTGDSAIDAVLREYIEQAEEHEIVVTHRIQYKANNIKTYDLCTVISNVLKNAIEACSNIENSKKTIDLSICVIDKCLQIIVKNSVKEKIKVIDNKLSTTKEDKRNHGLGSEIVRQTVEKYEGTVDYISDDKLFTVEIFMQAK